MTAEQLRESILKYAIQGKLVPQILDEESASVLLERIKIEKKKLVGKNFVGSCIYKAEDGEYYENIDGHITNINDEIPFDIPYNWEWCRFPNLVSFNLGKTPERANIANWANGTFPWVSISDMNDKCNIVITKEKITQYALDNSFSNKFSPRGTLLMSFKLTVGRTSILEMDAVHNEAIISIFPYCDKDNIIRDYLKHFLSIIVSFVETTNAIKGNTLNSKKMSKMLVPVPPLEEQKRIVEKIEQLEPLIAEYDKFEKQATKLDNEIADKLKKSILQYAIEGKLVSQNADDEPTSVLLERIKAEKKKQLGKKYVDSYIYKAEDGNYYENIKGKDTNITEEIPFEIPNHWQWIKIGDVFNHNTGKALNSSNKDGEFMTYITTSNLYWNKFDLTNLKKMRFTQNEVDKYTVKKGDLLVCEGGDYGRSAIWDYEYPMRIQNHIHKLRPIFEIEIKFYYYVMFLYKNTGIIGGKGIGIQGLSSNVLDNIIIPLPPLEEQKRIVAKIEQLFNILK